tara:strand:+ start:3311 stop:3700 length:390 start_codon:yes stop_codon:yes gene_type:complete
MKNVLISLTLLSSISGCASFSSFFSDPVKPIQVKTVAVEKTKLNIPNPTPLKLKPTKWVVITVDNAQEVFAKLKKDGVDVVLFGITDDGYKELSMNFSEIRNYISTQHNIIAKYKEYYEPLGAMPETKN